MQNSVTVAAGLPPQPLDGLQLSLLQQAVEGLSRDQLAWASGYLAGLRGVEAVPERAANEAPGLTILYATQGGNARSVAERLAEEASGRGFSPRLVSVDHYRPRELARERLLAIVISTQGEGEPPESALQLFSYLKGKKPPQLDKLRYAIFGLGDSSYERFNQAGRDLDQLLQQSGATSLLARVDADLDYEGQTSSWQDGLLEEVERRLPAEQARIIPLQRPHATQAYDRHHPYQAELSARQRITTDDAVGEVHHLALEIDAEAVRYQPGDALGVSFKNDPVLIEEILDSTGLSGESPVSLGESTLSLEQALTERLELTQLHPKVIRSWATLSDDSALSALVEDAAQLRRFVYDRQFIDLLQAHPVELDAQRLAEVLLPQQPRLYSIASSQALYDDEIHLTVAALRYRSHERDHLGGASGYLSQRSEEGERLSVYVAENPGFRLPQDGDVPIIMVGAGTGIAPYRAFLQQREVSGDAGRNWLVFGNRHFHRDFLYQTDWLSHRSQGRLDRISLAFSRDEGDRSYVQARLYEEGAEIYRWLQEGAHLYVCGGIPMEQAVREALHGLVQAQGGLDEEVATTYIESLREQGRYQRDVY